MPDMELKLTVYQPAAGLGEQVSCEYDLTIVWPDLKKAKKKGNRDQFSSAQYDKIDVTGTLSLPNPAAPAISPFRGEVIVYDNSPAIAFPLTMWAKSTKKTLKFKLNLAFPGAVNFYSGAITFGEWPGPLSDVTASFLCPR